MSIPASQPQHQVYTVKQGNSDCCVIILFLLFIFVIATIGALLVDTTSSMKDDLNQARSQVYALRLLHDQQNQRNKKIQETLQRALQKLEDLKQTLMTMPLPKERHQPECKCGQQTGPIKEELLEEKGWFESQMAKFKRQFNQYLQNNNL